jgi:hypothetical protein
MTALLFSSSELSWKSLFYRVVYPDWFNPDPDPVSILNPDPQNFWIRTQCGSGSTKENLKTNFFLSSKNQYKSQKILVVCTISYLFAIKMFKKLRKSAFFHHFSCPDPQSHWIRIQSGSTTLLFNLLNIGLQTFNAKPMNHATLRI